MRYFSPLLFCSLVFLACQHQLPNDATTTSHSFEKLNGVQTDKEIACQLTTPELQARKAGAIAELRKKVLETVETEHGYAFRFAGSDETLGELMVFIQSERQCCSFFTFKLGIQDPDSPVWLEISGVKGAKGFIKEELGLAAEEPK